MHSSPLLLTRPLWRLALTGVGVFAQDCRSCRLAPGTGDTYTLRSCCAVCAQISLIFTGLTGKRVKTVRWLSD